MRERGDLGRDADEDEASARPESEYDRDKELTSRCLKLMLAGRQASAGKVGIKVATFHANIISYYRCNNYVAKRKTFTKKKL